MIALAARIFALVLSTTCWPCVVNAVNKGLRVALRANLLHVDLGLQVIRTMSRNCVGKVPAQPVRWIVCNLKAVDAAHVARGASGHKHVASRKCARIGVQFQQIALGGEHNPVLRFVVNLDLRVIGTHVALPTRAWQPREFH